MASLKSIDDKTKQDNRSVNPKLSKKYRVARRKVYDRYEDMRNFADRKEAEADWEYADKQFRLYEESVDARDWRAHLNMPDAFAAIQAQNQETIERTSRPVLQRVEDSDRNIEEFSNAILQHNMNKTDFDYQYFLSKQSAASRGTAILWDYYRVDKRIVQDLKGVDEETGELTFVEREITDFDDDYTEQLDLEYFQVDPAATSIEEAIDCIRREILEIEEFQRIYGDKPGFEYTEYVLPGGDTTTKSFFKMPKDVREQDVEVLHYYNRASDEYIIVANNIPIHVGPLRTKHKELPFAVVYQYRVPGRFWGMGIPKIIKSLSEERKALRHLNLDRQKLQINKSFIHNRAFDLDEEDLVSQPHNIIGVDTGGLPLNQVLQPLEYGDVPPSYFRTEEILLEDIRRAHGIDDRIQGVNQGGTATEAAILKESSLKRLNMLMILNEMDTLRRVGRLKWSNIQFFYPTPRFERIFEDNEVRTKKTNRKISIEGKKFSLKTDETSNKQELVMNEIAGRSVLELDKKKAGFMQGEYDVVMNSNAENNFSKAIKQAKTTEMVNIIASNEVLAAQLDPRKAVEEILRVNEFDPTKWLSNGGMTAADARRMARAEIELMRRGIELVPTKEASEEHILEEARFTKTAEFEALPENIKEIIEDHIMGELEGDDIESLTENLRGAGQPQAQSTVEGNPAPNIQPTGGAGPQIQAADLQPTGGGEE